MCHILSGVRVDPCRNRSAPDCDGVLQCPCSRLASCIYVLVCVISVSYELIRLPSKIFVARKRTLRAESSTVLPARGGSSDGETEVLEGDAQAASFFPPLRVAIRVAR